MCSGAMLHARLDRVVFGAADPRTGVAGSVLNLFANPQLNHQTRLQGGVCADEGAQLLKDFFKPRRINPSPLREDALRTPEAAFDGAPDMPGASVWLGDLPSLQGLQLHFIDTGPAHAKQATLWVHGPKGWSLGWHDALRIAPPGRHIAVDLIGFGRSDKPKKESFHQLQTHVQILDELCQRLALEQVQLVGPSDVQGLLQALAAAQPGRYALAQPQTPDRLDAVWRDAPYPDKGYRAGPRALPGLR